MRAYPPGQAPPIGRGQTLQPNGTIRLSLGRREAGPTCPSYASRNPGFLVSPLCHSCVSRNPVHASPLAVERPARSRRARSVIPAKAAVQGPLVSHSHESGNPVGVFWIPACAGMTHRPLTRLSLRLRRPLDGQGRGLKDPSPGLASAKPASPARGEADFWIPACAGMTHRRLHSAKIIPRFLSIFCKFPVGGKPLRGVCLREACRCVK